MKSISMQIALKVVVNVEIDETETLERDCDHTRSTGLC